MQKGLCSAPQLSLYRWLRPALSSPCYSAWHCPPRQLVDSGSLRKAGAFHTLTQQAANIGAVQAPVLDEREVKGMSHFLDSLKWDDNKLVTVIVQVGAPTTLWLLQESFLTVLLILSALHAACRHRSNPHASLC